MSDVKVIHGDCLEVMKSMRENCVDAIVTDPPYGLEFMGAEWDKLGGAKFTSPGIGDREVAWPSFGGATFGGANPTCAACGGRLRGARKCECDKPDWRVKGKKAEAKSNSGAQMQLWHYQWAVEALRIAKPGAYLLAFGGTRTFHRLACAIEDAGWEIRDNICCWIYGSGFPKGHDVSKALDKLAGAERVIVGTAKGKGGENLNQLSRGNGNDSPNAKGCGAYGHGAKQINIDIPVTAPATDAAKQYEGYNVALKPAWEPIICARKPLIGTVAANVMEYGTGGLNIDGCRIEYVSELDKALATPQGEPTSRKAAGDGGLGAGWRETERGSFTRPEQKGRWPANFILGHHEDCTETDCVEGCPVRELGKQSGTLKSGRAEVGFLGKERTGESYGDGRGKITSCYADKGTAARFFYQAKPSKAERTAGLPGGTKLHPTMKPIQLMRYLVRLVAPPTDSPIILDPFCGSGTTGCASVMEDCNFIGIDQDERYVEMAKARIEHWSSENEDVGT